MPSPMLTLARRGWLPDLVDLGRQTAGHHRAAFLGAALRAGILQRLARGPRTAAQLAAEMGYDPAMTSGLASWLDLGVDLKELSRRGGRYALRSRRARRLAHPANDPLAAMYEEVATLDHALIVETPQRLAEGRPFEMSDLDGAQIARSSRLGEPWIAAAVERAVPETGAFRLLEVGCGTGVHLRTACARNPELTAVGLDLQPAAAELARTNIETWGLADRVSIEVGDVRAMTARGDFDLVTLHQNIYYFPEDAQVDILRTLGAFLRPGGKVLVTSVVRGAGLASSALDLWGAMTRGAARLPVPPVLVRTMQHAGLVDVRAKPLGADRMYYGFLGTRR